MIAVVPAAAATGATMTYEDSAFVAGMTFMDDGKPVSAFIQCSFDHGVRNPAMGW